MKKDNDGNTVNKTVYKFIYTLFHILRDISILIVVGRIREGKEKMTGEEQCGLRRERGYVQIRYLH